MLYAHYSCVILYFMRVRSIRTPCAYDATRNIENKNNILCLIIVDGEAEFLLEKDSAERRERDGNKLYNPIH